jgi:hypothetical protein
MKAIREDQDGYEVVYHGINHSDFERLVAEANGDASKIVLYGRVGTEIEYANVQGQGFVYATDYDNRENATPGASAHAGILLALGYNGFGSDEIVSKSGEYLVPLSSYKVLGIVE